MLLYQRNYNSDVWEDRIVFLPNKIQEKKKEICNSDMSKISLHIRNYFRILKYINLYQGSEVCIAMVLKDTSMIPKNQYLKFLGKNHFTIAQILYDPHYTASCINKFGREWLCMGSISERDRNDVKLFIYFYAFAVITQEYQSLAQGGPLS